MKKFKSVDKMSKKEKKEYYAKQRNTWGINPVTRKPKKSKAYNRNDMKRRSYED